MAVDFRRIWCRFRHCDAGVTLVEYSLALTVAILVGTAGFTALVNGIEGSMDNATAVMVAP